MARPVPDRDRTRRRDEARDAQEVGLDPGEDDRRGDAGSRGVAGRMSDAPETPLLLDPYLDWVKREGIPVHEDFGFDLLALDLAPWARMEARGAFAHAHGRGDFVSMYVCE